MTPSEPQTAPFVTPSIERRLVIAEQMRHDNEWAFAYWKDVRALERRAIEREAQGIPPSEALRAALTDIMSMTVDHLDEPRMRVIHKVAQRAALATPSGGIPLIDVELLQDAMVSAFRATALEHWDWLKGDGWPAYSEGPDPDVTQVMLVKEIAANLAAEYQRLASESGPSEEGAAGCDDPEHPNGAFCINTTGLLACYSPVVGPAEEGAE